MGRLGRELKEGKFALEREQKERTREREALEIKLADLRRESQEARARERKLQNERGQNWKQELQEAKHCAAHLEGALVSAVERIAQCETALAAVRAAAAACAAASSAGASTNFCQARLKVRKCGFFISMSFASSSISSSTTSPTKTSASTFCVLVSLSA